MPAPVLVLLRSPDWGSRHQATALALTAAAFGHRVVVALSGAALRAWVEGRFDEGAPAAAAGARVGSLRGMLDEGRRELELEVVACETEVRLAGLDPEAARRALDALRSLPEQWRGAVEGRVVAF
jgi:peroxiredoxin family protein